MNRESWVADHRAGHNVGLDHSLPGMVRREDGPGVDVGEPSPGTKVPTFGKSSETFVSKGCIFKKKLKVWFKIFEGFEKKILKTVESFEKSLKIIGSIKSLLAKDICYTYL